MIKSYIRIAWRNLFRDKSSSFINISGLAVGMAVAMLIGLWIYDELSFDRYHADHDRIGRVMQQQTFNGVVYTEESLPFPLGAALQAQYGNDFDEIVMASWEDDHILSAGDKHIGRRGIYMDKGAPDLLSLKMIQGDYKALLEPGNIMLAASTAEAVFGKSDPMGQLMKIDNAQTVKVAAVYEDLPYNTTFRRVKFIASWELYAVTERWVTQARDRAEWGNNSFQAFVKLKPQASFEGVNKKIRSVKKDHLSEAEKLYNPVILVHPMNQWHLRSYWENGVQQGGQIEYVWLFGLVGVFVLVLACINFMNLSTARSEKRSREVGVRKAIGSMRRQLIFQFYTESLLIVLFAFLLGLCLVQMVLPVFNTIADKQMLIPWAQPLFWFITFAFALLTAVLAGSYPALYLSSFQPVKVLKGTFKMGRRAVFSRKVLVGVQFAISLTLIIGTTIVYRQVEHSRDRPVGYDRSGMVMITMKSNDFYGKYDLLRTELKQAGVISEMAESSSPLTSVWSTNTEFDWAGKAPDFTGDFNTIFVTHEFGKTVEWQMKAGRDFSRDYPSDASAIILNETAVKFMGLKDPVGSVVRWQINDKQREYHVVGVVKDLLMESPFEPVKQTMYFMQPDNVNVMLLRLHTGQSVSNALAGIEKIFKKIIPSAPFEYEFVDQSYAAKFALEARVGRLAAAFAILAIFISCMGLFGLTAYVVEQRTREIGIRKVLGASVTQVWGMLSADFIKLVALSCLVTIPVAWYAMHQWLQQYNYRTSISWTIFLFTAGGVLLLTLATVSMQAVKAALTNPAKSLKSE
ncbi:MAG: ABC transporter permease [Chitinophagaceae bacterium]